MNKISLLYDQSEFQQKIHGSPEIATFLKSSIHKLKLEMKEKACKGDIPKIL